MGTNRRQRSQAARRSSAGIAGTPIPQRAGSPQEPELERGETVPYTISHY
jgi:hypothetical protein